MGDSFSLLDLPSQAIAVQRLLKSHSEQEKLSWLAWHGEVSRLPIDPRVRPTYRFVSTIGMECAFFIDGDEFVFIGDHTTYTIKESKSSMQSPNLERPSKIPGKFSQKKPNRVVMFLGLLLLLQFFGGGLAVFINLFFPILSEAAFCILAIVLMAEFVLLFVVGKCVQVISGMRALSNAAAKAAAEPDEEGHLDDQFHDRVCDVEDS